MQNLIDFLNTSYTAYQAVENAKALLLKKGFTELSERENWALKNVFFAYYAFKYVLTFYKLYMNCY